MSKLEGKNIMSTLQISLPDELRAWVENEARGNGYADAGEFVGVLVRQVKEQREVKTDEVTLAEQDEFLGGRTEAELAALINEGLASESRPFTPELWADILGEADEAARKNGLESDLRASFLAEFSKEKVAH